MVKSWGWWGGWGCLGCQCQFSDSLSLKIWTFGLKFVLRLETQDKRPRTWDFGLRLVNHFKNLQEWVQCWQPTGLYHCRIHFWKLSGYINYRFIFNPFNRFAITFSMQCIVQFAFQLQHFWCGMGTFLLSSDWDWDLDWDLGPGTWDLGPGTWDLGPRT